MGEVGLAEPVGAGRSRMSPPSGACHWRIPLERGPGRLSGEARGRQRRKNSPHSREKERGPFWVCSELSSSRCHQRVEKSPGHLFGARYKSQREVRLAVNPGPCAPTPGLASRVSSRKSQQGPAAWSLSHPTRPDLCPLSPRAYSGLSVWGQI